MKMIRALAMSFIMYSRIPMPKIKWDEKSAKYQMCFFPAVGVVIGVGLAGIYQFCKWMQTGEFFRAALLAVTPLLLTGGIHLDGFLDTVDALSCYGAKEKKLDVLKDSNSGAFAVIYGCAWFLVYTAALSQLDTLFSLLLPGFVLSRALSALAVLTFQPARKDGMGAELKKQAAQKALLISSFFWIVLSGCCLLKGSLVAGGAVLFTALCEFFHYRWKVYREFGGFTGDLAGWFLCRCELEIGLVLAICERMMELWF